MNQKITALGASTGNFLEFYNFTAYAFFSPMIAHAFFPSANRMTSLLLTLVTFAFGFVTRPFGAIAFGYYEKLHGRRAALLFTFLLMGVGTAIIAGTPSYNCLGLLAPFLIVLARALQGFAEGGEVGPATTLLLDLAPARLRPHFASLQFLTQMLAGLAAVTIGAVLAGSISQAQLFAWGWRLPFVLGLSIVPLGMLLRRGIVDSPVTEYAAAAERGAAGAERGFQTRAVVLTLAVLSAGTIGNYVRLYGVSYAVVVLHLPPLTGMLAMASGLVAAIIAILVGLRLGRVIPPRSLFILSSLTGIVLTYPVYALAAAYPGLPSQVLLNVVIAGFSSLPTAYVMLAILEALPRRRRSAQFGLLYALSISIFGGSTQPVVTWLIRDTGSRFMPCWVLIVTSLIAFVAMLQFKSGWHELADSEGSRWRQRPLKNAV